MTEKRIHGRNPIQLDVELVCSGDRKIRGKTRDISLGGLFIEAVGQELPAMGAPISVTFPLPPHQGGSRSLKGRVRRLTHDGIAVIFIDFGLDEMQFLDTLLSRPA